PPGLSKGTVPFVRVKLTDGSFAFGYVKHYSTELELADRELVLRPPLFTQGKGDKERSSLGEPWDRMILRGAVIDRIDIFYHEGAEHPNDVLH
ncbi:MAG: DUF6338 family protein, partial [Blastococcus sp.]